MMRSKRVRCISLNEIKKFYCWYALTCNGYRSENGKNAVNTGPSTDRHFLFC